MSSPDIRLALDFLPAEVLLSITSYLCGQDLKHLRLSCMRLASIVESRLFEDIVVVPYQKSFQGFSCLANHPTFRKHVQSVTYDCRRLAADEEPKYDPTFARMWALSATTIMNRSGIVDMTEILSQRRALQRTFLNPESDGGAEEEQLRSSFSVYSNLRRVTVKGGHDDKSHSDYAPRFHRQMVVKAQLIPNTYTSYSTTKRVELTLAALHKSGCAISDLQLENVDWLALRPLGDILTSVQYLRLHLHYPDSYSPIIHDAYRQLGSCLNHPVRDRLQNLEIFFRPSNPWLEELEQVDLKDVVLLPAYVFSSKCHYPGLRKLHIGTYYTYEHDLLGFLMRASSTLKSLTLEHIGLLAGHEEQESLTNINGTVNQSTWSARPSTCWVKVIKFLQSKMNLEYISFLGTLVSCSQRWECRDQASAHRKWLDSFDQVSGRGQLRGILNSYPEGARGSIVGVIHGSDGVTRHQIYDRQNCLRSRVQRFVIEGGECPLDSLAVGAQKSGETYEERLQLAAGDYSWETVYIVIARAGLIEPLHV